MLPRVLEIIITRGHEAFRSKGTKARVMMLLDVTALLKLELEVLRSSSISVEDEMSSLIALLIKTIHINIATAERIV